MALPVKPVSLPAELVGVPNGKAPAALQFRIPDLWGGFAVVLCPTAARSFLALRVAALTAGFRLSSACSGCSYRTYEEQVSIFLARYTTTPNSSTDVKKWNGKTWYKLPGVASAAAPGTSNHGRLLAIDVIRPKGLITWLVANEHLFGFSHEIQSEEWHIRYFAGDTIPKATLAYEQGHPVPAPVPPPTPPSNKEDEDVFITLAPGKGVPIPVVAGQHARLIADGLPQTGHHTEKGVTVRLLLGRALEDGKMVWRNPVQINPAEPELTFVNAGKPPIDVTIGAGETNLIVEHIGREQMPVSISVY